MSVDKSGVRYLTPILFWVLIVVVYILLRVNPVGIPLDRDECIFGLVGRTILNGGWPYRDLIDHKPPLVFLIYSFCLWLFPPTPQGIHSFLHLYNFVTLCVLFCFAKKAMGGTAARWVAFVYAVFSINPMLQGFTASTEMFMLLPLCLSLLLAWMGSEAGKPRIVCLVLSGVFGAVACWIKQPAVFSVLFGFIIIGYRLYFSPHSNQPFSTLVKALLLWMSGGVGLSAAIITPFAVVGLFDDFYYWSFQHNFAYSGKMPWAIRLEIFGDGLIKILANSPVIPALICIGLVLRPRQAKLPFRYWLLFLLLSALGIGIGFAYAHYYAQILPAFALLAGLSSAGLCKRFAETWPRLVPTTLACLIVVGQLVPNLNYHVLFSPQQYSRYFFGANPFPESEEIAKFLKDRTLDDDSVFVFGSEPQILLLAERRSASAFGMIYPLMRKQYVHYASHQLQTIDQIKANEPAYIVRVMVPASLHWDQEAKLHIIRFLDDYLKQHYRLDGLLLFNDETQAWQWQSDVNNLTVSVSHIALYKRVSD